MGGGVSIDIWKQNNGFCNSHVGANNNIVFLVAPAWNLMVCSSQLLRAL